MGRFDKYNIDLKGMHGADVSYDFLLDDSFFADFDNSELQKGKVNVQLSVKRLSRTFELDFHIDGVVRVPCDRCLDDVDLSITSEEKICVKFGRGASEEVDNLIIVPDDSGILNVAGLIYEFVVLAVPLRHVHASGKCNSTMSEELRKHICNVSYSEDFEKSDIVDIADAIENSESMMDPRWSELKKLFDNN